MESDKKLICSLVSHRLTCSPFDCKWAPNSSKVVTVGFVGPSNQAKGDISIHKIEDIDLNATDGIKLKLTSQCEFSTKLRCCTFQKNIHGLGSIDSDRLLAVGDFAGNLSVWDIDRLGVPVGQKQLHNGTINAIDSFQQVVATGGKDGKAVLWDIRTMAAQHSFEYLPSQAAVAASKKESGAWSIYTDDLYMFVGYESGDLSCYDLRTSKLLATYFGSSGNSVSSIAINSQRDYTNILLGGSESKPISFVNFNNNTITEQPSDNKLKSKLAWCTRYSPFSKSTYAVSTSEGSLSLYTDKNNLIDEIKLADYPVLSVDFNGSKEGLMATVSLNKRLNILVTPFK